MILELTDENFEREIQQAKKPVLVDFWAFWCVPCSVFGPILEKIAAEFEDNLVFAKVNLDAAPAIAQKYGIDRIPAVILFKEGEPISGFFGARPEEQIREWLNKIFSENQGNDKDIEETLKFYQEYADKNGFKLNPDRGVVERIIKGLLANEKKFGARYCPCRRITGNLEEDRPKICPCSWHKEEIEKQGHCFCGLFTK